MEEEINIIMQRVLTKESEIVQLTLIINKLRKELEELKKTTEEKPNGKTNKQD